MFLYEFLWRGQSDGSGAYHVVLADAGVDAFGKPTLAISDAMMPAQAKARGFDLPKALADINVATHAQNRALADKVAELTEDKARAHAALSDAQARVAIMEANTEAGAEK
jgi:hypothetical protein